MSFICGVVEGFYGVPWNFDERKDLFERMSTLHFNTYVYGPKDDTKHRKCWREKYIQSEQDAIQQLIKKCHENSVEFVYSLSPGLDIVFSSDVDIKCLHEKFKQVQDLGCHSFALLFDDINPELCLADKSVFLSFGDAQATITNNTYSLLQDRIKLMMFCPTEYCTTRAKPDITSSEYLKTLGTKLHKDIQIMWTGEKVISKTITHECIKELTNVLKRKPLLWDNIHTNDYDNRRLFLGPYKGRTQDLYDNVSGVLTNPNCEHECNYVALNTLSMWISKCKDDKDDYDPDEALEEAINGWMELFKTEQAIVIDAKNSPKFIFDANSISVSENNTVDDENTDLVSPKKKSRPSALTQSDVMCLCHLFYLPYEHGTLGKELLEEFKWLKENAIDYKKSPNDDDEHKIKSWNERSIEYVESCGAVEEMFERLNHIPNKRLLQQLYSYIYDVKESVASLCRFVKWLGSDKRKNGECFFPSSPEPWFYRGGISGEIQRMLPNPLDGGYTCSGGPSVTTVHVIRPYTPQDKDSVYKLCRELSDFPGSFVDYPDLPGDSGIGAFLHIAPNGAFVLEVDDVICGYAAVHTSARKFFVTKKEVWLPLVQSKYKRPVTNPSTWSIEEEAINRLYNSLELKSFPESYEAILNLKFTDKHKTIGEKLLKCACADLVSGVFCQVSAAQRSQCKDFYEDLGFTLLNKDCSTDIYLYGWIPK